MKPEDKTYNDRCLNHQEDFEKSPSYPTCPDCKDLLIASLRQEIIEWKNAWYKQRDATGVAGWNIPSPFYLWPDQQEKFLRMAEELKNSLVKRDQ